MRRRWHMINSRCSRVPNNCLTWPAGACQDHGANCGICGMAERTNPRASVGPCKLLCGIANDQALVGRTGMSQHIAPLCSQ